MAQPGEVSTENDFEGAARNAVGDHATAEDSLGFAPYVEAIAAFLTSNATEPPLTISIEGEWGSGKSSFMLQLERAIAGPSRRAVFFKELPTALGGYTTPGSLWKAIAAAWKHKQRSTIQFNAWRHDKQDALWAAFALSVSKKLRQRVGAARGWWGDIRLFLMRLTGLRGWLELTLLLVSGLLLVLSLYFLGRYLFLFLVPDGHLSHMRLDTLRDTVAGFLNKPADKKDAPSIVDILLTRETAVKSSWGALLMLAVAGLVKFHKQLKVPISIDLKKYLSTPDYNGHAAFIETFHEDFARLVRAYAGNERIYIFIDDLDRCDVPKAAELMQAINLMISDAGRLVFILGMDREKVAAGITQKYKDLLPFLPEYATGISQAQLLGTGSSPLAFGYSYLEKFIQLSFTLPVIGGKPSLDKFLDAMLPKPAPPTSWGQIQYYWRPRIQAWRTKLFGRKPAAKTASLAAGFVDPPVPPQQPAPAASPDAESVRTERRIRKIRVKIAEDSEGVRAIVSMVSSIFENNPRRLKQFISTYRLALALSSDQGILEVDPEQTGVTPQQLGKFVALTMKFPDLRTALAETPDLLGELEKTARTWPEIVPSDQMYWRWLHRKSVRATVLYGVRETRKELDSLYPSTSSPNPYSLVGLDVTRLMSLLPKVPPPEPLPPPAAPPSFDPFQSESPTPAPAAFASSFAPSPASPPAPAAATPDPTQDELLQQFNDLAREYEQIRFTQRASTKRTESMTEVVRHVQEKIAEYSPQTANEVLLEQLQRNGDGNRIVALAIMCERVHQANIQYLLGFLAEYRSPFEHYWAIRATLLHENVLDRDSARHVLDTLNRLTLDIERDPGRVKQAQQLKARVEQILAAPSASSAMK